MKKLLCGTLGLVSAILFTTAAHATTATKLVCVSTIDSSFTAEITFDSAGLLEEILVDMQGDRSIVLSKANAAANDIGQHSATTADVQQFGLLQQLETFARGGSTQAAAFDVHTVSSKNGGPTDLTTTMERISDDLSGIVLMSLVLPSGDVLGTSIVIGWGGFFSHCK